MSGGQCEGAPTHSFSCTGCLRQPLRKWYRGRNNPTWNSPSLARPEPRLPSPVTANPPTPLIYLSFLTRRSFYIQVTILSPTAKPSIQRSSHQKHLPNALLIMRPSASY